MSWLGKVLGGTVGFMMGGPLGAVLGTAVGHQIDKGRDVPEPPMFQPGDRQRVQMAFFTATFSVMGHIAKADGYVSKEEIKLATSVMNRMELSDTLRQTAIKLFTEGKSATFPLNNVLAQFRKECHGRTQLIRMFIEIEMQIAFADGGLKASEERLLLHICQRLGFSRLEYQRVKLTLQAHHRFAGDGGWSGQQKRKRFTSAPNRPALSDAYAVLGVKPTANDAEIKRAYRRLISQHHPDKLVAKGLPEEMMKIANEKTHQIRKAYDQIQNSRGKNKGRRST